MKLFDHIVFKHSQNVFNWVHNFVVAPLAIGEMTLDIQKQYFTSRIVAHRGLRQHPKIRENTLRAFELAWKTTPHLEFDLQLTQDGHFVIHHDQDLMESWRSPGVISEMSIGQVKRNFPSIPTLVELISSWQSYMYELFPRKSQLQFRPRWFIELKDEEGSAPIEAQIESLQKIHQQLEEVCQPIFISLSPAMLRAIKQAFPENDRCMVYLISKGKALEYLKEDPQSGLLGWFFNFPKTGGFCEGHQGMGFLNHPSSLMLYHQRNQKSDRPVWIFTDRPDRLHY